MFFSLGAGIDVTSGVKATRPLTFHLLEAPYTVAYSSENSG